jgi:aspartate/methionine/tyrosine aminotransferase
LLDEEIAFRYLAAKGSVSPRYPGRYPAEVRIGEKLDRQQNDFEWIEPGGRLCLFPRPGRRPEHGDIDRFYRILLEEYGTYVGPGHWFECPAIICG